MNVLLLLTALMLADPIPPVAPKVEEIPRGENVKPTEMKAQVGKPLRLSAPDGKPVVWEMGCATDTAELFQVGQSAVFVASKDGVYDLLCYTAEQGVPSKATRVRVTVGAAPNPPGPMPPDNPPAPPVNAWQAAYERAKNPEQLALLIQLYTLSVKYVDGAENAKAFREKVAAAAETLDITGLTDVRKLIAAEFAVAFPSNAPLDEAGRTKLRNLLLHCATQLKGIKP